MTPKRHFRKVLVTGGAGLVGSHIVDQLVDHVDDIRADRIVVLDNFTRGNHSNLSRHFNQSYFSLIEGDIRDADLVRDAINGCDLVFHQAALRITQCAEEPRSAMDSLVMGAFNIVEAASCMPDIKVIAASSASVYGQAESFPTTEDHHPYNNDTIYGAAKTFNEGMLRSFRAMRGLRYVALRYFNIYGPRMDMWGVYTEVLIRWMERIAAGQSPLIFGDGKQTMDFVYIDDIARANILAAMSDIDEGVFNIASGAETSLEELATALLGVMNSNLRPEHYPPRKVNAVERRLASTKAAREKLGFEVTVTLDEGLRHLVRWWQSQRQTPSDESRPQKISADKIGSELT